ncbi:hypothetical protein J7T55_000789 [Diaporthe amygdali]|uniref:uncharacterized protein n=1 Tax=Phomopsis amygdali TaxID=1214568 RepID=UPI0022FE4A97|nr:uncharacterized protein J7T55_000789 [Diaporthe amygdali]KAJ0119939.1 hypothetical protein J7T55_000789 [Diaporthe amygdali]
MHGIIEALWDRQIQDTSHRLRNGEPVTSLQHAAYTRYYLIQQTYLAHELGIQDSVEDVRFVSDVAKLLRSNLTHQEVISVVEERLNLEKGQVAAQHCEEIVSFTARLLVMMNMGRFMSEAHQRRNILWGSRSLRDCVDDFFSETPQMSYESVKLPKAFNAWSIETVAGIKVRLIDNLADHLLLVEDDTTVLIFHHASFLECQHASSILPKGLAEETLRTLALLFPQAEFSRARRADRNKTAWLKKLYERYEKSNCLVDGRLTRCGNLTTSDRQVQNFRFWRDRLVVLKQAYDEATPTTLTQWWHDRRNGVQWYTFWVAVLVLGLTIFFGLVQSIEGALQVYKAYNP